MTKRINRRHTINWLSVSNITAVHILKMVFKLILSITLITLFVGINGQVRKPGNCPSVSVEQNFNVEKYLGVWYEQKRYFARFQTNSKCVSATYGERDNNTVSVRNSMINTTSNVAEWIDGYAEINSKIGEGKLLVYFPTSANKRPGNYWILDTDYDKYSVVWSCFQMEPTSNFQMAWILTRDRTPSADIITKTINIFQSNGLDDKQLINTDQMNC